MIRVSVGDFKIGADEKAMVNQVLEEGRISEGKYVRSFERSFSEFIGVKWTVAVNSGTSGLIAGLTALTYKEDLGIKPGTNVITTPLTYIATSSAIVKSQFNPIYVDVSEKNFAITPQNIKAHLEAAKDTSSYSLILPVHLMGYPCDMDEINRIAKEYGLQTFEDSSQAHGTLYKGRRTGSLSLLSAFSFYIAHNIQAGEMGAVTTNDYELARLVNKIKAHGRLCDCPVCIRLTGKCPKLFDDDKSDKDPRFSHDIIGYNFKTTEIQAALALSQLKKASWIIKKRQENVKYLNECLSEYSDIIQLPEYSDDVSYLAYCLVIKKPERISRKKLREKLEKSGVETRPLFGCIPTQQVAFGYLRERYQGELPIAEHLGSNSFYVGCHQYLTRDDLNYMVKKLKSILKTV